MNGIDAWLPNDPPGPAYMGLDRSAASVRLSGRTAGPGRFRWWLGYKLHALAAWVLGGIP